MKLRTFLCLLLCMIGVARGETLSVGGVEFAYRLPPQPDEATRIFVLFGGRNWKGERALQAFGFDALADQHNVLIISPSFVNNDYWEPQKWSGALLKQAIQQLETRYKLKPQKIFLYGYSAGGQCASLFYHYMPEVVAAWGAHACGVYPETPTKNGAPALVTCGADDEDRMRISRRFIYAYRENGGNLVWKLYPVGHALNPEALALARAFFAAILEGKSPRFVGEDDSLRVVPVEKAADIDAEFQNPLYGDDVKKCWQAK